MKRDKAAFQGDYLLAHGDGILAARKEEQQLRRRLTRSGKQVVARNSDLPFAFDAAVLLDGIEHALVGVGSAFRVSALGRRQQRHSAQPDYVVPRDTFRQIRAAGKTDGPGALPAREHREPHGLARVGAWSWRRTLTDGHGRDGPG